MRWIAFLFATASLGCGVQSQAQIPAQASITFDARGMRTSAVQGLADRASRRALTLDDPVRIASISKLFVALGVMRLVDQKRLDLSRDVSDYLGFRVRNPAFPERPITLALLLSHRSSMTDDADYIITLGDSVETRLRDPRAWDQNHAPGSWFRYTNLSFPIIASVMEMTTGERFDRLMERLVFKPLRLDACFNWTTCDDAKIAKAVVLYDVDGSVRRDDMRGGRPSCPVVPALDGGCNLGDYRPGTNGALFSPHGGVRISARDLARTGQMLLRRARGFLKPATFKLLTMPVWRFDGSNGSSEDGFFCSFALGVQVLATAAPGCSDDPFGDGHSRIGHAGEAYGLRSGLWVDLRRGTGVTFFTTAVPDDAAKGHSAFTAREEAILQTPYSPPDK